MKRTCAGNTAVPISIGISIMIVTNRILRKLDAAWNALFLFTFTTFTIHLTVWQNPQTRFFCNRLWHFIHRLFLASSYLSFTLKYAILFLVVLPLHWGNCSEWKYQKSYHIMRVSFFVHDLPFSTNVKVLLILRKFSSFHLLFCILFPGYEKNFVLTVERFKKLTNEKFFSFISAFFSS